MLDPDISTAGALRHLSRDASALDVDDAGALDRRRFLQLVGMGLGAGLGQAAAAYLPAHAEPRTLLGLGWIGAAFALLTAPICFAILFRARRIDLPWICFGSWLGFSGARLGTHLFGAGLGAFLGALALSAFANAASRLTPRPVGSILVPGLMLLVPGTIGYRSISAFLVQDVEGGVDGVFRMLLVAASLGAGVLGGQALLPSRRDL